MHLMMIPAYKKICLLPAGKNLAGLMVLFLLFALIGCSPHKRQASRDLMTVPDSFVEPAGIEDDADLQHWVDLSADFVLTLPPKKPKQK